MFLFSRPFLYEVTAAGERIVSWRVWLFIWLVPAVFALAVAYLSAEALWRFYGTIPGQGVVVRVYAWPGETVFDRDKTNYSPVFRYEFAPGDMTEASTGMSNPKWNFEVGSTHEILFKKNYKTNVTLPGPHNWAAAWVIAVITLIFTMPAIWAHRRVRRWQRQGA